MSQIHQRWTAEKSKLGVIESNSIKFLVEAWHEIGYDQIDVTRGLWVMASFPNAQEVLLEEALNDEPPPETGNTWAWDWEPHD